MAPAAEGHEDIFVTTLDSAQDYLALQQSLAEALRAGFLSLAQARYSMGADRVSALQYPSHMHATARLRRTGSGELELAETEPAQAAVESLPSSASPSSSSSSGNVDILGPAAAVPTAASGTVGDAGPAAAVAVAESSGTADIASAGGAAALPGMARSDSLEEQLKQLRLAAQQSDHIVDQLAAKYGCGGDGGAASSQGSADLGTAAAAAEDAEEGYAEVTKPNKPLHWFGSLVAPSLRDAEAHFGQALTLAVQAANVQHRLRQGIDSYQRAAAPAASVAAATPQ